MNSRRVGCLSSFDIPKNLQPCANCWVAFLVTSFGAMQPTCAISYTHVLFYQFSKLSSRAIIESCSNLHLMSNPVGMGLSGQGKIPFAVWLSRFHSTQSNASRIARCTANCSRTGFPCKTCIVTEECCAAESQGP